MKYTNIMSGLIIVTAVLPLTVTAADSWQEKLLFNPTPAQIEMENERQRIMIYNGLTDVQVMQAMEQQFDRVEHMMFTGTVITDSQGEVEINPETGKARVEDDGC
ncbi:MAG: hypothetical protein OEX75_08270 [Gammaproteobacteria bacterium]|nr:hypothetical protein [Gammaproteobacteria bacterium]